MDLQAKHSRILLLGCIVLASFALTMAQPPGLTKPSSATCKVEKYKECYNLVHVCPKFCPDTCHVNCVSCKPICGPAPPGSEEAGGAGDDKGGQGKGDDDKGDDDKGGKGGEGDDDKGGKGGKGDDDKGGKGGKGDDDKGGEGGEGDDDKGGKGGKGDDDKGGKGGKGGGDDGGYTPTPAVPSPTPPTPTPAVPTPTPPTPTPAVPTPTPPTPTPAVPSPTPPTPTPPTPTPPTPTPAVPSPTPPTPTPPTPTPAVPSPTPPTPAVPSPTPPTPTPAVPSPTPPTPTPPMSPPITPSPPFVPYPSPPDSEAAGGQRSRVKCNDYSSEECYGTEYYCPDACPNSCEVDCVRCRSVCKCDKPGSVCQDPRFIGGDGLTFYFHGKKDSNFCLISDPNLHVNAHFIGKRTPGRARDFTWVQSIAILFGTHRLYVGALKTATWDDSVDRISVSFDGNHISLPELDGATWNSYRGIYPSVSVKRINADTNNVEVEVEGLLKITARVVPITMEDSRIHGYDVKEDDCLAHLDLGFKFYDLSDNVDGVLGQTYRPTYVSRVKIGVHMPVMGGDREFQTPGLFEPDCAAAKFTGNGRSSGGRSKIELPEMNCASGLGGKGVVCKR